MDLSDLLLNLFSSAILSKLDFFIATILRRNKHKNYDKNNQNMK